MLRLIIAPIFPLLGTKKRERQIALSLSVGGGYLLSHFRSTIGVVRLNFSVRNGKRWDPHAITTLVRFQCACHVCGFCRTCDKVERNLWKRWLELLYLSKLRESAHRQPCARPQEGSAHISGLLHYRLFNVGRYKNHTGKLSGD